jgi:hypothetical protein
MPNNPSLAIEFVTRYHQLIGDHKTHDIALEVLEREFDCYICGDTTTPPTFFFCDNTYADWVDGGWDLNHSKI